MKRLLVVLCILLTPLLTKAEPDSSGDSPPNGAGREWIKLGDGLWQGSNWIWHAERVRWYNPHTCCYEWKWEYTRIAPSPGVLRYNTSWRTEGVNLIGKALDIQAFKQFTDRFEIPTPYGSYQTVGYQSYVNGVQTKTQGYGTNYYPGGTTPQVYGLISQNQSDALTIANMVHQTNLSSLEMYRESAAREERLAEQAQAAADTQAKLMISLKSFDKSQTMQWQSGSVPVPAPPNTPQAPQPNTSGSINQIDAGKWVLNNLCQNCHASKGAKDISWNSMVNLFKTNPEEFSKLCQAIETRTDPQCPKDKAMPKGQPSLDPRTREVLLVALDSIVPPDQAKDPAPQATPPQPMPPQPNTTY